MIVNILVVRDRGVWRRIGGFFLWRKGRKLFFFRGRGWFDWGIVVGFGGDI